MRSLVALITHFGAVTAFTANVIRCLFTSPRYGGELLKMMDTLARRCLIPVGLAVAPVGAVISLQGVIAMRELGAEGLLAPMLGTSVFRLYSPMLASVMVAAQAGSSIAARLGTMKVRGQIDALEVMSVDPVRYLVVPGFLACMVVAPLLNILATILGLASGWLFAVPIGGVNHGVFMNGLLSEITLMDLWVGMGKCTIFGGAVGLIAGYLGLRTSGGAEGVGRAANNTVVTTILLILIADYALGVLFLKLGI